ncbi:conserved hypothetical protein [Verticillium alfalfae VaMs.102]|uniref:Chromatin modification-related protein EAF6 n=1 Tax=Verticillium alfalfae (strain VaMs.102 / ATCC MYA-4576 / FGSC 10136) TaxID=526221 RepID=C9SII4_VERA1|nr:conserved hypothetical protein [Verticillium alfalfae VaMs.102]EEY18757.1 conserved hypothetical protein [Verticillium alfalfae VaMs.102]
MAENVAPTTGIAGATPSLQMYKQEQVKLKAMLEQRNQVARRLAAIESDIETKEAAYLDSTPHGNIIAGFDNYIKGHQRAPAPSAASRATRSSTASSRAPASPIAPAVHVHPDPFIQPFTENRGRWLTRSVGGHDAWICRFDPRIPRTDAHVYFLQGQGWCDADVDDGWQGQEE